MNDEKVTPPVGIVCSDCKQVLGVIKLKGGGIVCARCWMNRHYALKNPEEDEEL